MGPEMSHLFTEDMQWDGEKECFIFRFSKDALTDLVKDFYRGLGLDVWVNGNLIDWEK